MLGSVCGVAEVFSDLGQRGRLGDERTAVPDLVPMVWRLGAHVLHDAQHCDRTRLDESVLDAVHAITVERGHPYPLGPKVIEI